MVDQQIPDGAAALDAAATFLDRFVAWPTPACRDVAVLWATHTHACDMSRTLIWASTPRIAFVSDEPASGKTFAMARTLSLAARPVLCCDPTPAAIIRAISEAHSTVGIDEIDLLLRKGTAKAEVRTVLNAGYERHGTILRADGPRAVMGPVALAGLDVAFTTAAALRPTYSRSIVIRMTRAHRGQIEPFRERLHGPRASYLSESLAAWVAADLGELADSWPEFGDPDADSRSVDIWEPLMSIADQAGGSWPQRARDAFAELAAGNSSTAPTIAPEQRILADLQVIWPADEASLPTQTVIGRLVALKDSPYARLWPQPELAGRELAGLLTGYGIEPQRLPRDGGPQIRGYLRSQFTELWAETASVPETAKIGGAA
jgi:hypothetical protein